MFSLNLMRAAILVLATFSAVSAVVGLGAVFIGAYYPIMAAGVGIELGKYGLVAYSYQNWQQFSIKLRLIVCIVVIGISSLTAVGIFGYLANSSRDSRMTADSHQVELQQLQASRQKYEDQLQAIDKQIAALPNDFVTGRLRLLQGFNGQRQAAEKSLAAVAAEIKALQTAAKSRVDLGPIEDIAAAFGTTVETAVNNMMLALTLSLDPFALFLTVLVNRPRQVKAVTKHVVATKLRDPPPLKTVADDDWNFK